MPIAAHPAVHKALPPFDPRDAGLTACAGIARLTVDASPTEVHRRATRCLTARAVSAAAGSSATAAPGAEVLRRCLR